MRALFVTTARRTRRDAPLLLFAVLSIGAAIGSALALWWTLLETTAWVCPDQERVMVLMHTVPPAHENHLHLPGPLLAAAGRAAALRSLAFASPKRLIYIGDPPEEWTGCEVSQDLLSILNAKVVLGRTFVEAEFHVDSQAVLISHAKWTSEFGRDPRVIGRSLRFNERAVEVVGVLAPTVLVPIINEVRSPDFVVASSGSAAVAESKGATTVIGALRSDMSLDRLQAELDARAEGVAGEGGLPPGSRIRAVPIADAMLGSRRRRLLVLLVAPAGLLCMAYLNLAYVLIVRQRRYASEGAIALALGARLSTVVAPVVLQALAVGALSSVWGLAVAEVVRNLLATSLPPTGSETPVNATLVWTCVIALGLCSAVVSAAPVVWRFERLDLTRLLNKQGTLGKAGRPRPALALLASEVALAVFLSSLCVMTLPRARGHLRTAPSSELVFIEARIPPNEYSAEVGRRVWATLAAEVGRYPGTDVGITVVPPTLSRGWASLEEPPGIPVNGWILPVSSGYFRVIGAHFLSGRSFTPAEEDREEQVAVLNETAAKKYFPETVPLNAMFRTPWHDRAHRIVGVVADVNLTGELEGIPLMYTPVPYSLAPPCGLLVRTTLGKGPITQAVAKGVRTLDRVVAVRPGRTVEELAAVRDSEDRFGSHLFLVFSLLAVVTTGVGSACVASLIAAGRVRESAVKVALGLTWPHAVALVYRDLVLTVGAAAFVGTVASRVLGRSAFISSSIETVEIPRAFGLLPLLLTVVVCTIATLPSAYRMGQKNVASLLREAQ
ncbi:MAG: ABC transporter permease [Gemmatimonadales bacterium]|nr:ABC transporter permease [Gemmatimonadales bacterium]